MTTEPSESTKQRAKNADDAWYLTTHYPGQLRNIILAALLAERAEVEEEWKDAIQKLNAEATSFREGRDEVIQEMNKFEQQYLAAKLAFERSEKERDQMKTALSEFAAARDNHFGINAVEAERDSLRAALAKYGSHRSACRVQILNGSAVCTCGFAEALNHSTIQGGYMPPQSGNPVIAEGPSYQTHDIVERIRNESEIISEHMRKSRESDSAPIVATPHNPDGLTPEQVGVADGWRLLDEDEVVGIRSSKQVPTLREIEALLTDKSWNNTSFNGDTDEITYRTKLTRAELRKARGLPEEVTKPDRMKDFADAPRKTPETDAQDLRARFAFRDFARKLERERDALRAELQHIGKFVGPCSRHIKPYLECEICNPAIKLRAQVKALEADKARLDKLDRCYWWSFFNSKSVEYRKSNFKSVRTAIDSTTI